MNKINKEQLVEIAKAGFPERVKQFINFDNCEMLEFSGVYRLYDKDENFIFMLPENDHLAIFFGAENFIQITSGINSFNHYAAIEKMKELNLVP